MSATLENRYGVKKEKKSRPRWFWYAVAAVLCAVGIVFVAWVQVDDASHPTARDSGFDLVSNDEAKITFELVKQPEDSATCAVKALNSNRAPVGWKEVTVGPTSEKVSVQEVTLRTLDEATTVTVDSCWKTK